MKIKKLLEILNKKCPVCNKILTHDGHGQWRCIVQQSDIPPSFYHIITTNQMGNLSYFCITYNKYRVVYYNPEKMISIYNNDNEPIWNAIYLFSIKCANIQQFLINNSKNMEDQIDKLLILC